MSCEEVKVVLANLTGEKWLMAALLYGSGLRLLECLRLRVQEVYVGQGFLPEASLPLDWADAISSLKSVRANLRVDTSRIRRISPF